MSPISPIPTNLTVKTDFNVESPKYGQPQNVNISITIEESNEAPSANTLLTKSKKLQEDLEMTAAKMREHEDNLKFLKAQKNQLDDAILDLQVSLGKSLSSGSSSTKDADASHGRSEEETIQQILKHEKSAARIYCLLKSRHDIQLSNPALSQEFVGVVALLGKVDDDNLSSLFSEYLGSKTMLAMVCKTIEGINYLETYDFEGAVSKLSGIYALGASIGQHVEGRFDVVPLEYIRQYPGEIVADDPQRRLDIPKPKLPNGDIPAGFLGFAVNMLHIDEGHLSYVTSKGCGLRETLFFSLFSRLQVYKTRAEMLDALPCITHGAVSVDGGMVRGPGDFSLGARENVSVRFPKCSTRDHLPENHSLENQLRQKKWEKEKLQEDIRREQSLLDHEKLTIQLQKFHAGSG